jgi:FkbM family methyltransferase
LPLRLIPPAMVVRVVRGPLVGARWIAGAHIHGCWLGTYERDKAELFAGMVTQGGVLYDIGANVGYYAIMGGRCVGPSGQVYAFEPVPRNVGFLRRHIEINGLRNVSVIEAGVSDAPGETTFDLGPNPAMGHIASTTAVQSVGRSLTIRLESIDDLLNKGRLRPPNWVKIDVEGAEELVLAGMRGCLMAHKPTILLATHSPALHASCDATLRALGYSTRTLEDPSVFDGRGELLATPA